MTPRLRFEQPSFRDRIAPVGAAPPTCGPCSPYVDFGASLSISLNGAEKNINLAAGTTKYPNAGAKVT
jgi:hypothetical protein